MSLSLHRQAVGDNYTCVSCPVHVLLAIPTEFQWKLFFPHLINHSISPCVTITLTLLNKAVKHSQYRSLQNLETVQSEINTLGSTGSAAFKKKKKKKYDSFWCHFVEKIIQFKYSLKTIELHIYCDVKTRVTQKQSFEKVMAGSQDYI